MSFSVNKFKKLNLTNYKINEKLSKYTTFNIGGSCLCYVQIVNIKELKKVIKFCLKNKVAYFILGCGSNVLFEDSGFNGVVISFSECFYGVKFKENKKGALLKVGAGVKLTKLNLLCAQKGFSGLEFSFGIPASIGGAICSNAGSFGYEIGFLLKYVKVLTIRKFLFSNFIKISKLKANKCNFSYRSSIFKSKKYIILNALFTLKKSTTNEVSKKMNEYYKIKKQTQPLGTKNAGCIFKNGKNYKIAQIIDSLNLKGKSVKDAQISTKHCGFIVNNSKATCQNVKDLINCIQQEVYKNYKIKPELEVEIVKEGENNEIAR